MTIKILSNIKRRRTKKQNNLNDSLGIKKTIINFLVKHRESIQKDIMNKSALSQKN